MRAGFEKVVQKVVRFPKGTMLGSGCVPLFKKKWYKWRAVGIPVK